MAVPTFERFFGPTLQSLSDGAARTVDDVVDLVAWHFNLSDADRSAMTRGGSNTQVRDRINWTTTYLAKAGLLNRPLRNHLQITERGKSVLLDLDRGAILDIAFLHRFPEFVEFQQRRGTRRPRGERPRGTLAETATDWKAGTDPHDEAVVANHTPRCRLTSLLRQFVAGLETSELLAVARSLLSTAGYHHIDDDDAGPGNGDVGETTMVMGLDAIGVARVLVQAIRADAPVPSSVIHRFVRAMSARRCRFGVLIAQHDFAPDARETLALMEKEVVLIDGHELARRLADRAVGGELDAGSVADV